MFLFFLISHLVLFLYFLFWCFIFEFDLKFLNLCNINQIDKILQISLNYSIKSKHFCFIRDIINNVSTFLAFRMVKVLRKSPCGVAECSLATNIRVYNSKSIERLTGTHNTIDYKQFGERVLM